jgi:hypothetical protein
MSTDLTTRIAQDHLDAMFAAAAASRRVKEARRARRERHARKHQAPQ